MGEHTVNTAVWIYLGIAAIAIALLFCHRRTGHFWRCTLFTAFSGIGALVILRLLEGTLSTSLDITPLTLLISGSLGIPGVIAMLILHLI